ncbi:MAG: tryptophan synthase subunit alpha [Caldisphaera sp.]|nr:MAG: tryptophan synthase subunit alpha [Caldisphaera sp.]
MKSSRKLLVCYMTLGYPNKEYFLEFIKNAEKCGCDMLEVGIPTKNAKYDGPIIRRSYEKVINEMIDVYNIMKGILDKITLKVIALAYLEDYMDDFEKFLSQLKDIGINRVLFPDLTIDYIDDFEKYNDIIKKHSLKNVIFTTPSVPDKLIEKLAEISDEFLYYGIRPTTGIEIPISPDKLVKRVRSIVNNKLVVGFGLSFNDIRNVINSGADGVAIGSAFIERIEKEGINSAFELIKEIRGILDEPV